MLESPLETFLLTPLESIKHFLLNKLYIVNKLILPINNTVCIQILLLKKKNLKSTL